jgi:hypothetical protein
VLQPISHQISTPSLHTGSDKLCVGDDKGLEISHIGSSSLFITSFSLQFNNILHVPAISKSLLSISQLLADNNVSVVFNSNSCFIMDLASNQVLFQVRLSDIMAYL